MGATSSIVAQREGAGNSSNSRPSSRATSRKGSNASVYSSTPGKDPQKFSYIEDPDIAKITDDEAAKRERSRQLAEIKYLPDIYDPNYQKKGIKYLDAMPDIVWKPEFELGVDIIDEQHHELVRLLNVLNSTVRTSVQTGLVEMQDLGGVLDDLVNYTAYHFKCEEMIMDQKGYPISATHKKVHKNLVDTALSVREKYRNCSSDIGPELLDFLKNWLITHILYTDKKFAKFLIKMGAQHFRPNV